MLAGNDLLEILHRSFPEPHINQRSYNGPHHVAQKPVCRYRKYEPPLRLRPLCMGNMANERAHIGLDF